MKSNEYWEQRAIDREQAIYDGAVADTKEWLRLYDDALETIEEEVSTIKRNFINRYGIDNQTAEYFLTRAQQEDNLQKLIEALETAPDDKARKQVLEYIHRDGLSVRAYSARIERYNALKETIYANIKQIAVKGIPIVSNALKRAYNNEYDGYVEDVKNSGVNVGLNFAMVNKRAVEEVIQTTWHGSRFSERIWKNTDRLAETAQRIVSEAIVSGKSSQKAARELRDAFGAEQYHADTLIRTELAHAHNMADMHVYEDLGFEEYKYLATLDERTCDMCGPLDGQVFKTADIQEGVNYPTMHPRCRCTTTIVMDYNTRSVRNPITGKTEYIDGDMTYDEWRKNMSPQEKQAFDLKQQKIKNKSSDKKQYEQYKEVLGVKNVGRSFDKWQEMKYTDREKYGFVKLDYNRQNSLKNNPSLALPNAKNATADDRKFTEYLFGGTNERGLAKGRAFANRLGYDIDNYVELKKEIINKAEKYPVTLKNSDEHGQGYEQKIILYGKKNTPANVIVGWKTKDNKTWMTSAYIKEVK